MRCYTTEDVVGARKAEVKFEAAKLPNREIAPMFAVLRILVLASEHESSTAETRASRRVPTCETKPNCWAVSISNPDVGAAVKYTRKRGTRSVRGRARHG
jgi:hypothetical protein